MTTAANPPPAATPATPATPAAPAVPAAPAPGEEYKAMSPDAFKARLAEERNAGTAQLLKALGFEKPEQLQAALGELKTIKQASMSDAEKMASRIKELEAQAALAAKTPQLQETIRKTLEAEESAIPESRKELLTLAPVEPELRLPWIAEAKKRGLFADAITQAPQPVGLSTTKAGGAPPPSVPGASQTKHPRDMTDAEFAQYEREWKSKVK